LHQGKQGSSRYKVNGIYSPPGNFLPFLFSATMTNRSQKASQSASLVVPPSIYIGPLSSAFSKAFLTSNSINYVLSIGPAPRLKLDGVVYHRFPLADLVSAPIAEAIKNAGDIIDAALKSQNGSGKILVHCSAGISRSPTVVVGYLMKRRGMRLVEALGLVIRARPQVTPNPGFLLQLKKMERELFGSVTLHVDELPRKAKDRLALFEPKNTIGSGQETELTLL
jgi:atypical dual specificity phosphatase